MSRARLAILPDFAEEKWPSMDLVAEQLLLELKQSHADRFETQQTRPQFVHRMTRLRGQRGSAINIDRLYNRFISYPRYAKKISHDFDLFHVCDHSYSQVVLSLPADRTGVFCHDLDTFRCLLEPAAEPRPKWFRAMASRILKGMQRAAVVFHTTVDVRTQIERYQIIDPAKLIRAPLGVSSEFFERDACGPSLEQSEPTLLHVGSCIPRKRIDVLLKVFAAVRAHFPHVKLRQIGGEFTDEQRALIADLGIESAITQSRGLARSEVAQAYRSASLVLVTSDAEGFGLPLAEALAAGAIVLASDIPVLREVGGDVVSYAPVADIDCWSDSAVRMLSAPDSTEASAEASAEVSARRSRWAEQYSWRTHAAIIARAYERVLAG